jgi:spermidine synthase
MILLLGLGGGSAIGILQSLFPQTPITAVDIDPVMVSLGEKYLPHDGSANVRTVICDANDFVMKGNHPLPYAIVLVDLYVACTMPPFAQTEKFLLKIKHMLKKGGAFVCNASYTKENQHMTNIFVGRVKKVFPSVETILRAPNFIIRAYTSVT